MDTIGGEVAGKACGGGTCHHARAELVLIKNRSAIDVALFNEKRFEVVGGLAAVATQPLVSTAAHRLDQCFRVAREFRRDLDHPL